MNKLIKMALESVNLLSDIPPLLLRLIVAYGFYAPAVTKLKNVPALIEWFTKMGLPLPALNAYMSLGTEVAGVMCLILGLGTRLICVPLMVVMVVAISTVHWKNGFPATQNGYQIPLYFFLMLFSIFATGPGRFSADNYIYRWWKKRANV